jgi:5-formyltetrahydrofolate cyclo-ligase
VSAATADKQTLRQQMRRLRRAVDDQPGRSARIWETVTALEPVRGAATVMVFTSIRGEPDTAPFAAWCDREGKRVVHPEDDPAAALPDVVIVPGVAFTAEGYRLGQGGGWYDRFLARVRDDCVTIGVGFSPQLVDELPVEAHDVRLDVVVTDEVVLRR